MVFHIRVIDMPGDDQVPGFFVNGGVREEIFGDNVVLVVRGNLEQQAHSLETRRSVGRQFVEQQKAQAAAHPITTVRRVRKGVKAVSLALPI